MIGTACCNIKCNVFFCGGMILISVSSGIEIIWLHWPTGLQISLGQR